jgi:hypothetical protein
VSNPAGAGSLVCFKASAARQQAFGERLRGTESAAVHWALRPSPRGDPARRGRGGEGDPTTG